MNGTLNGRVMTANVMTCTEHWIGESNVSEEFV